MERNYIAVTSKNTRRINVEQRARLLDLVERNRDVLLGNKAYGHPIKNQVWQEIASTLNQLGYEKSVDQWRKTWVDIKSAVKKKAAEMKAMRGMNIISDLQLSEEDYQVLRMCNIQITDSVHDSPIVYRNVRKINPIQQKTMLDLIEENLAILCNSNIQRKLEKWSAIAASLNALGPKKPIDLWRRIWIEMKKSVKRKMTDTDAAQSKAVQNLSDEDRQIIRILEAEAALHVQKTIHHLSPSLDTAECEDMLREDGPQTTQSPVKMESLKWLSQVDTLLEFQRSLMDDRQSCDITLAFQGRFVKAHRLVLCASSSFLRDVLRDVPIGQEATIIIPEVEEGILENVLSFIYTGETRVSLMNLDEFLKVIGNLGIKNPINFDYATNCTTANDEEESAQVLSTSSEMKQEIIEIDDEDEQSDEDDEDLVIIDHSETDSQICSDSLSIADVPNNEEKMLVDDHTNATSPNEKDASPKNLTETHDNPHTISVKEDDSTSCEETDNNMTMTIAPQINREREVHHPIARNKNALRKALLACTKCRMSVSNAATKYNVPPTLLQRHLAKYSKFRGRKKLLK